MNPLNLPPPEGDPPEPYIDPLAAERALADDLADVLDRWISGYGLVEVERVLARYREARQR